ncbi:MAG: transcription-repair coupling factor, partial [Ectothiorhodospiraceae bacterium]|nr:transcription-repair coupling factor [Ectothiorhodospiraceae bacterium]
GDVGYGKTEVAVRAAFKAIMDGKQVAILVPTTILAQQHYNTFRDRLSRYSVEVEVISRFRTKAEQTEIVSKVKSGKVDILIGTHRLLSKDIAFANLGLLVVDEEHRFGVAAKEKLRMLRENVDTLTMTATPIPRTLNFSLLGARDLSTIETPPKNRLPIITSIVPWSKDVIVEGIRHELERGGQVYFVNDKVKDIDYLADTLRSMLPDVRIAVAHGQMRSTELERIMMRFMEKKIDVLVATKIIESGLDIPNANTIFINRSERFGLAELYQLRGRVGRSNTQAFAYLLIPTEGKLSRDALKRLQAIEEFSELGTGFHLSMRDLEIRGAGNLLGAEQSGFIFEIGFELYMATVDEAVQELKEEEFNDLFADQPKEKIIQPRSDVIVELGLDAYFPQDYIGNSTERFELYKKLYNAQSEEEIKQVEEEVFDRFGLFTQEAENLFYIVRLRLQAAKVRLSRVTWSKGKLLLGFPPQEDEDFYEHFFQPLITWIMDNDDRMKLTQDAQSVQVVINDVPDLKAVEALLEELVREVGSAVTTGEAVDEHAG